MRILSALAACILILSGSRSLQAQSSLPDMHTNSTQTTPAEATQGNARHTEVTIYPILAYAPIFGADFNLENAPGGGGEGGVGGSGSTDTSFNGAALAGVHVCSDKLLFDFSFLWAGLSASRKTPKTSLDVDFVYAQVLGGYRVYRDFYAAGGVKRLGLNYHAQLEDLIDLRRKPGFWDPMVGVVWERKVTQSVTTMASFLGGGFGVGSDVDLSGQFRANWEFVHHFSVLLGWSFLHVKDTETIVNRGFTINQTLNGPVFGFGIML